MVVLTRIAVLSSVKRALAMRTMIVEMLVAKLFVVLSV